MYNQMPHQTYPKQRALQALHSNNIKHFLNDWFTFRLHISFKKTVRMDSATKRHFYGNEHQCTLSQVLHGHVREITLNRLKGLTDLIKLVEKDWKGKWTSAVIYMRDEPGGEFNKVVRRYFNGKIEDEQSPILEKEILMLYFHGLDQDRLPIFKTEPLTPIADLPDFKKEIADHLLKN